MRPEFRPKLDFSSSPTIDEFVHYWPEETWDRPVLGIFGPVGSGKSTGCCAKVMMIAMAQMPDPADNIRKSRIAIIRATTPQLKSTTIKTWEKVFPPENCGRIIYSSPITHRIRVPVGPKGEPGLDAEFIFLALDNDKDVYKLKSMDLTAAYINEADGVSPAVFSYARGRLGRFPSKNGKYEAMYPVLLMDCNAVDEDEPLAEHYHNPPESWKFWRQPPAVLEVEEIQPGVFKCIEEDIRYRGRKLKANRAYRGAGRLWILNPEAENLRYLQTGYYQTQVAGRKLSEIQRDLQVKFVFSLTGKPVIPDFSTELHVKEFGIIQDVPLEVGSDVGGGTLNPAAVIFQRHTRGPILVHDELSGNLGVDRFNTELNRLLQQDHFKGAHNLDRKRPGQGIKMHTDPAGEKGDEIFETAITDHLRGSGWLVMPAWSNSPELRIEAITNAATRIVDHVPGLLIHPRCRFLHKALAGKWQYRRLKVSGKDDRYHDKPDKTHPWSDLGDALGYGCMGAGEARRFRRGHRGAEKARVDFDVYGNPAANAQKANTNFDPFNS